MPAPLPGVENIVTEIAVNAIGFDRLTTRFFDGFAMSDMQTATGAIRTRQNSPQRRLLRGQRY